MEEELFGARRMGSPTCSPAGRVRWYVPQGARCSRAPGLGRAGARVGVRRRRRRLRPGLCGRAVGVAAGRWARRAGDAGPGAAAPPRSCRNRRPKFRRICSARSSTTRWAISTRRYRPRGAPPSCHPLFRRAHALQDSGPEPRGTPGREGPREGPREHRPGAAAGRASCGALLKRPLQRGLPSRPLVFPKGGLYGRCGRYPTHMVTVIRASNRGSIHRTLPVVVVSSGQCCRHLPS